MRSVRIIDWAGVHHVFTIETFFKIGESIITTQKAFHAHFKLHWNDAVQDRKIDTAMG